MNAMIAITPVPLLFLAGLPVLASPGLASSRLVPPRLQQTLIGLYNACRWNKIFLRV